jgi:hypothetical protein
VSSTLQPLLSYLDLPIDLGNVRSGKTYGFLSRHSTPVRRALYLTVKEPEHLPHLTRRLLPLLSGPGVQGIFAGGFPGVTTGNIRVALGGNTEKRISEIENMLLEKVGEHSEYLGTSVPPGTTVIDSGIGRAPSPWVWAAPQLPGDDLFWVLSRVLHQANHQEGLTPGADESSYNKAVELGLDNAGIKESLTELVRPQDWPVPTTPQVLLYMLATQEITEDRAVRYAKIRKALEELRLGIQLGDKVAGQKATQLWLEFVNQERARLAASRGRGRT